MATGPTRRGVLSGLGLGLAAPAAIGPRAAAPALSITANARRGAAPFGLFLEAEARGFDTDAPGRDLVFRWDLDDPGLWAALPGDHPQGRARATAYGPLTGHVYATPGRRVIACHATDGRRAATARIAVSVHAPPRAGVQAVSLSGDFEGLPRGARAHRSLAAAVAALRPGGRLLLRAGERFDAAALPRLAGRRFAGLAIAAFGPGPRPVLDVSGGRGLVLAGLAGAVSVSGIAFEGAYDPATGLGRGGTGVVAARLRDGLTLHDCRMRGVSIGLHATGGMRAPHLVADCRIEGWSNYGLLAAAPDRLAVAGSAIRQARDASTGPGGRGGVAPRWADHGPVRLSRPGRVAIRQSAFFSNTGWSGIGQTAGAAHQQCIRWNSGGGAGARGVIERCLLEGGYELIAAAPNVGRPQAAPGLLIVEKCYLLATANTLSLMVVGFGGTTVRNCLFVRPDVPAEYLRPRAMLAWRVPGEDPENLAAPVAVISNAFVDLRRPRDARDRFVAVGAQAPFTRLAVVNNIRHAPALAPPVTPHAPLETAPALFVPRYDAKRHAGAADPAFATPPGTPARFRPLPGSPALGAAAGPVAPDDFDGALRGPGPTAIGPYHGAG